MKIPQIVVKSTNAKPFGEFDNEHFTKKLILLTILLLTVVFFANCEKRMSGGLDFNSLNVQDAKVLKTFETAKANNKNVLLIFDAEWCGYCRKFNQIAMKDAEVKKTLADFEVINVDVDKYPKVLNELTNGKGGIGVPLIMLFSPEGIQTDQVGGYVKAKPFNKVLKKNL